MIIFFQLFVQYIKQITSTPQGEKMLRKQTSQKECFSNYSQSFSNLHCSPLMNLDLKELNLRKSLFDPPRGLAQIYEARKHIIGAQVPIVQVVHSSYRWLLLQVPRFSRGFFRRLNSGRLGNPYQQLLKVFKGFVALTKIYGYFRPTMGMILMEQRNVIVWINEDVFSNGCSMALGSGFEGEKQFVVAFLAMVEGQVLQWQRVSNIYSIDDTFRMLDWRAKLNRGSMTAIKASKEVQCLPYESKMSFEPNELECSKKLNACRSMQEIPFGTYSEHFDHELSNSVTIKQEQRKVNPIPNKQKKISRLFTDQKDLKNSYSQNKNIEGSQQVRKTKKKFNLTSTSSTLSKFSQKWRATVGKKTKKIVEPPQPTYHEQYHSVPLYHHKSEPLNIQNQFEGLFNDQQERRQLKFGVEGNKQQLEKIAEQIQQVLIW